MRRQVPQRASTLAFLRNSVIEALEPRNAASTVSIASATIPVGPSQGGPKPAGALASVREGIAFSPPDGILGRVTTPTIPGRIGVAIPRSARRAANPPLGLERV